MTQSVMTTVKLNKFKPRPYQIEVLRALENKSFKRALIIWPRRCLSGDTHIIMANGSYKLLRDIEPGDQILSWNGKSFEKDFVKNKWKTESKPTLKLQADGQQPIITSKDHLFAVISKEANDYEWRKAEEITQQEVLIYANTKNSGESLWNGCYRLKIKKTPGLNQPLYDIETEKNHNFIANGYVVHNSGKDIVAFNFCIRQCIKKPQVIYYIFPTYAQAKKVIWDSITNDGMRFLDFIPSELIETTNSHEMKVRFKNGSLLQLVGSDNFDALLGSNPQGIVFSEYALQDPRAYQFLRPILVANGGWALFESTPRGRNHLFTLYELARNSPDWYCSKLTVLDTGHISLHAIEKEKAEGLMSEDLIQQEYFTSFSLGVEGGYYTKYIDKMRLENRITDVPYESGFKVHTAWDLGMSDNTSIIFFQNIGTTLRIIDCYENASQGLEHYAKFLQSKPYVYGRHIAPHDIKVRELGTGISRLEKAHQLGIDFVVADNVSIMDGIEAVRSMMSHLWVDENRCEVLLKALENYRREFDAKKSTYKDSPLHNWASHMADAARYMAISLSKTRDGMSAQELEQRYQQAVYGNSNELPSFFRDTKNYY